MSDSVPALDAIPLPGESKTESNDKKKSKLRRLKDSNQLSSIMVTKVVTTKPSNITDPATKLKAIAEKKKNLPNVSPSNSGPVQSPSANVSNLSTSIAMHSKNQPLPPSQTIVDELFKDFLAAKQREEQIPGMKKKDPDMASSMEEMNKLLDQEISSINAKQTTPTKLKEKKKGRWDSEEKKGSKIWDEEEGRESKPLQEKKKGRWDSEVKKERTGSPTATGFVGMVSSHGRGNSGSDSNPGNGKSETDEGMRKASEEWEREEEIRKGGIKLGLKLEISKESISWINSGEVMDQKKKVILEEGEVLSSSSDDNSDDDSDESDGDDDLMETGSIDSDKEGKSKSKKKKKHKHKHKKKKKHKSGKGERKSKEKTTKSDKDVKKESKKDKSDDGKKKEKKKDEKKEHKSKSADKRKHSRSRSRSPKKRRSRSRSRENRFGEWDARNYRSRSRSRSADRSRSHDQPSLRDRDYKHRDYDDRQRDYDDRYREYGDRHRDHGYRDRDRISDRDRGRDRDRDRDRDRHGGKSKGKEMGKDLRVKIDKSKLRKIAIANVLAAVKAGEQGSDVDLATLKAGGKSVEELTDFCKKISEKEKDYSDSDSDSDYGRHSDGDDLESPFINHPFKLRDPSNLPNIIMNIRNSKQLPVLTPQAKATQSATLRLQFPVSSGSQHRQKEHEWVPVEKTTAPPAATTTTVATLAAPPPPPPPPPPTSAGTTAAIATGAVAGNVTTTAAQAAAQIATSSTTPVVPPEDKVFKDPPPVPIDIGAIVSERLSLVRKLTENPYDVQALCSLHKSQEKSSQWAQSKFLPGHFTGSTGVQILSQQELAGPDKRNQAWFKKDQLKKAAPLQGGIGMWLLQKMGWKQGEGLGKNNEGSKEPLMLDFKIDRKGLTSEEEKGRKGGPVHRVKDLSGKHPVSALTELCNKRRWGPPNFITVAESGPDHKKNFLFKVVVNKTEYQPSTASANKKLAKAQAATVCLQTLGLIPRE